MLVVGLVSAVAASIQLDALTNPWVQVITAGALYETQERIGLSTVQVQPPIALSVTAPVVPSSAIQTTVLGWIPAQLRWRRAAPTTRATAPDTARDKAVAVVIIIRGLTPTVTTRLGPSETPDEPDDACALVIKDAKVGKAIGSVANAQSVGRFLSTATQRTTVTTPQTAQAVNLTASAKGVDRSSSYRSAPHRKKVDAGRTGKNPISFYSSIPNGSGSKSLKVGSFGAVLTADGDASAGSEALRQHVYALVAVSAILPTKRNTGL